MYKRYPQIQGIRALAITGIFLSHTLWSLENVGENYPRLFQCLRNLGSSGVFTFFILSGFLQSYKGTEVVKRRRSDAIKAAWVKIKKLYPLHVISLVSVFILKWPSDNKQWFWDIICFPLNLTLTQDLIPLVGVVNSFNGPSWFLSAFFLLWVLVYLFPMPVNGIINLPIGFVLQSILTIILFQILWRYILIVFPFEIIPHKREAFYDFFWYFNPLLCYSEFLLGCCIGRLTKDNCLNLQGEKTLLVQLLTLVFAGLALMTPFENVIYQPAMEFVIILGVYSVLANPDSMGGAILSSKCLVYLGDISAYIFLIHGPFSYALKKLECIFPSPWTFIVIIILTMATSSLAYKIIENKK